MNTLGPILDDMRAKRAWLRYCIRWYVDPNGAYFRTVKTTDNSIVPTLNYADKTSLENGPLTTMAFPGGYADELFLSVRWRVMGLRTIISNGKRRLVRVWKVDWPKQARPTKTWLMYAGLNDETLADFLRMWDAINELDAMHSQILKNSSQIIDMATDTHSQFQEALRKSGAPLPTGSAAAG
jgi:hypothetical protein